MPEMQPLKPCARCEQELPEAFFDREDSMFCTHCTAEINDILNKKYSIIEAAHFRAQIRRSGRQLEQRLSIRTEGRAPAATGS